MWKGWGTFHLLIVQYQGLKLQYSRKLWWVGSSRTSLRCSGPSTAKLGFRGPGVTLNTIKGPGRGGDPTESAACSGSPRLSCQPLHDNMTIWTSFICFADFFQFINPDITVIEKFLMKSVTYLQIKFHWSSKGNKSSSEKLAENNSLKKGKWLVRSEFQRDSSDLITGQAVWVK